MADAERPDTIDLKLSFLKYSGYVFGRHYRDLIDIAEGAIVPLECKTLIKNVVRPHFGEPKQGDITDADVTKLYELANKVIAHERGYRARAVEVFGEAFAQKVKTSKYSAICAKSHCVNISKNLDTLLGPDYAQLRLHYNVETGRTTRTWKKKWVPGVNLIVINLRRSDEETGHMIGAVHYGETLDIIDPNGRTGFYSPVLSLDEGESLVQTTIADHINKEGGSVTTFTSQKGRPIFNTPKFDMGHCTCWTIFFLDLFRTLQAQGRAGAIDEVIDYMKRNTNWRIFTHIVDNYCQWIYKAYSGLL